MERLDLTAWDPVPAGAPDRTCLACHLHAALSRDGCTSEHRATREWAVRRGRDPESLVRWAASLGGCCCDCEVALNVLHKRSALRRSGAVCAPAFAALQPQDSTLWLDGQDPLPMPATCAGA